MASENECYRRGSNFHYAEEGYAIPAIKSQHSGSSLEDCDVVPEDHILLQMDQELDQRLSRLCRRRPDQTPSLLSRMISSDGNIMANKQMDAGNFASGSTAQASIPDNEGDNWPSGCSIRTKEKNDILNSPLSVSVEKPRGTASMPDKRNVAEPELVENDTDEEVLDAKEEAIFDEFLDQSTRIRIGHLTKKVMGLNQALKLSRDECKRLMSAKREASMAFHTAETERRNMNKQIQTLQQENSRLQTSNKCLQHRIKELTGECQGLRKELCSTRQSESDHRSGQSSIQAQLTRSRADNAAIRDQMAQIKTKHKEEVDELRAFVTESNSRIKDLERQQRNLYALVKKQECLITVLNKQKNNIAAAKVAACLEDKFLAIISPLQPP
ncbi:LOW QUALITY PROTEIN: testis-expressed protein 9 [Procambarus clarkii]|uniref:LOW QUALITY PROTEIN: testis-expressed protein 9 n=1 Tax=Procambarus clarkii TaxID=6728 RepID=UPI00374216CE